MRRTLLAAAALACALPLAACGGSDEIAGPPTPLASPSATASASASPSAPAKETPEQFIRRWITESERVATTGDVGPLESMYVPTCAACSGFVDLVRRIHTRGGQIVPAPIQVVWIHRSKERMHGADITLYVRESSSPSRYQERQGGPWTNFPGGTDTQTFYLAESAVGWQVLEFAQLAGSYAPPSRDAS